MILRDYQLILLSKIVDLFESEKSILLQVPTGGGKTHIAARIAQLAVERKEIVWLIAHRREIIGQTSRSMRNFGVEHGIVSRGFPITAGSSVQICSLSSLDRRIKLLEIPDLIIWDEAHHIAAKSWSAIRSKYPEAKHLGLTATPIRLDGRGLSEWFDVLICGPSTKSLIEARYLSRYRFFAPTIPDLSGIELRAGEYKTNQLAKRFSSTVLVGDVIEHYNKIAPNARAVVFSLTVEASTDLTARFNSCGIPAMHIDSKTSNSERDSAISALESGKIRILSNVEVFTEGFDLPAIDAIILLRPTRSLALYRQMVGRGLRIANNKDVTIILDHAGLFYEHGLPDEEISWSLDGVGNNAQHISSFRRLRRCPNCSCIHPEASVCIECGYIYRSNDRSIEEVFGELQEIGTKNIMNALVGFDTLQQFSRRLGKNSSSVCRLVERGLPRLENGLIPVEAALKWVNDNARPSQNIPPAGHSANAFEPQLLFARRVGMSKGWVQRLTKRGLPIAANGWVEIEAALDWLQQNRRTSTGSGPRQAPEGCESVTAFTRRIGLSAASRSRLIDRGLPIESNGFIQIQKGLDWIAQNGLRTRRKTKFL